MAAFLKRAVNDAYRQVSDLKVKELLDRRYDRLQSYGRYTDTKTDIRGDQTGGDSRADSRADPRSDNRAEGKTDRRAVARASSK